MFVFFFRVTFCICFPKNSKTKMEATAMNDFLQQLQDLVPAFDVASIPRDVTGVYASPVHIIVGLLNLKLETVKKFKEIGPTVNLNCTKMKVTVHGTEQRNTIMVGTAVSIMRVLASCNRPDMTAIVARLPAVAPAQQASLPLGTHNRPPPSIAPVQQEPFVAPAPAVTMVVDGVSADDLQDNADMTIQDQFDFVPAQIFEFVLKLKNGPDFVVPVRRDGYVNVTKICQAAGKRLDNWIRLDSSKESMEYLQKTLDDEYAENVNLGKAIPHIRGIALLTSCKGGNINTVEQGTFAHPDLAIEIATWAHKSFRFQVSHWIRELMITGRVELGKEKSGPELKQKLEETFQAVDEEEKAFLREKRSRKLLAIDENMVAKRAREEEDKNDRAAKRQRDDATAKEESRMQLVRFDAEIAAKAIATAEDLKLKRIEVHDRQSNCAKNLIDLQANFMPKLTSCLQPSLYVNARLRSAINDIEVNLAHKINKCLTGDDCKASGEVSGYQETLYCNDFQTFLREMGLPMATTDQLKKLGMHVSKKYKEANNNTQTEKTMKTVNHTNCQVNTYKIEHKDFIEKCIREYYGQSTASITEAAPDVPVAKPPKDMRSFFGVANVNVTISCKK